MFLTAAEVADRVVCEGAAPACAAGCAVRRDDGAWTRETGGCESILFDLASVTKPMTAVAVARSGMDRWAPLGTWVKEARGTPSERVSIELLLAHRAGLDAHRTLYAPLLRGERVDAATALGQAASARRDDARGDPPEEGFAPLYSDLGYLLAGEALARACRTRDAGEAIEKLVIDSLGLAAGTVRGLRERGVRGPFAPTEDVAWRGGRVEGAVHDENAWALTNEGGSGHAGIFATVEAVLVFGCAVLDSIEDLGWLVRERAGGTLRAGFDGKSVEGSSAGSCFGPRSFGHLGFTGTSLWIDPDARIVAALLTNRVCPTRDSTAIRATRPWAHDALWQRARALAFGV